MKKTLLLIFIVFGLVLSLNFISSANIFSVTDYNFGSGENVTMRSYGVSIENSHASWNESMVLWLQMTDDATDSSGNGNDGTLTNGASINYSWVELDGDNDYVNVGNDVSLNVSNLSISFWLNANSKLSWNRILGKEHSYKFLWDDTGKIRFEITNSTEYKSVDSSSIIPLNEWTQILGVFNGTNLSLYVNGALQGSNEITGINYTTENVYIGTTNLASSFNGSIDEVIIYNKSLTSTEITNLYNKGLFKHPNGNYTSGILDAGQIVNWTNINWTFSNSTPWHNVTMRARTGEICKPDFSDASLVSMWSLNQSDTNATKTSAVDIVGSNDGVALGGLLVGNSTGGVFQGENATGFDGSDDKIVISDDDSLDLNNSFSVSIWTKISKYENRYFYAKRDGNDGNNSFNLLLQEGGAVRIVDGGGNVVYSGFNAKKDEWFHFVSVINSTGTGMTNYRNGVSSSVITIVPYDISYSPLIFASRDDSSSYLEGDLAYVSIFNKSLTQDEIINWSTYTGELLISQGETLDLPVNRYLQYQAKLQTNDTKYTPILTEVNLEYDGTPPNVIINTPLNDSYTTNSITFNVTATDDTSMSSCEYSLDNGITNISMTNLTDDYTHTNSSMNQGSHTVIFYCKDRENNLNDTESVTFFVDSIVPLIEITYPANISYTSNVSSLNYTHTETNCDKVWWSNSSGVWNSSTQSCGTNWTDLTSNEGSNTWTVYINDTSGNENSSSVTFFKDTTNPSIVLTSPPDNSADTDGIVRFLFTPTDTNQINNCSLIYQNGIYTTSTSISNGVSNVIEVVQINELHALYLDDLQWSINCTDEYSNTGSSETRNLDTKEISQGGGGGGSSGTTLQNPKSIDLFYPEVWYRDSEVELVIKVYNQLGGLYSPEILLNFSIDGVQVTDSKTNFFDHIINEFKISKTAKLGEHKINIQVKDEKIIEQEITITIEEKKDKITSLIDTDEKMLKYLLYGGGGLIILTFLIIILTTISADKKRS